MKLFHTLFLGLLVSGLSLATTPSQLEPVLVKEVRQTANLMLPIAPGSTTVHSTITLEVFSGGCTKPEDFRVDVNFSHSQQTLSIVRVNPDRCEAYVPHHTLELETDKLQLTTNLPLFLANPVYGTEQIVN